MKKIILLAYIFSLTTIKAAESEKSTICGLAFAPDDCTFAAIATSGLVGLKKVLTGEGNVTLGNFNIGVKLNCVVFDRKGDILAVGGKNFVRFLSATDLSARGGLLNIKEDVIALAFNDDGTKLACSSENESGSTLSIWDRTSNKKLQTIESCRRNAFCALSFFTRNQIIYDEGVSFMRYDLRNNRQELICYHGQPKKHVFSNNGQYHLCAQDTWFNVGEGLPSEKRFRNESYEVDSGFSCLAVCNEGDTVAVSDGKKVVFMELNKQVTK